MDFHRLSTITPSTVLRSPDLLLDFTHFIRRGPSDDSLRLLQYLNRQLQLPQNSGQQSCLSPSSTPSSSQASSQLTQCPLPNPDISYPKLKISQWQPQEESPQERQIVIPPLSPSREQRAQQIVPIARRYYQNQGIRDTKRLNRLTKLSQQLLGSKSDPGNIWNTTGLVFDNNGNSRIDRLERGKRNLEDRRLGTRCATKISMLYTIHEIDELSVSPNVTGNRVSWAINKYIKDAGISRELLLKDRSNTRHLLSLLENSGPGDVVCTNDISIVTWTRELLDGEVSLGLQFRGEIFPPSDEETETARRFHLIGARLIINGLVGYGWKHEELSRCQGRVMMALFQHIDRSELAKGNIEPKRDCGTLQGPSTIGSPETESSSLPPSGGPEFGVRRFHPEEPEVLAGSVPSRAEETNKRPYQAGDGSEYQPSQRRRLSGRGEDDIPSIYPTGDALEPSEDRTSGSLANSINGTDSVSQDENGDRRSLYEESPLPADHEQLEEVIIVHDKGKHTLDLSLVLDETPALFPGLPELPSRLW
ncbi:hypothetical protein McanMca71_006065 [Microsporum canis]